MIVVLGREVGNAGRERIFAAIDADFRVEWSIRIAFFDLAQQCLERLLEPGAQFGRILLWRAGGERFVVRLFSGLKRLQRGAIIYRQVGERFPNGFAFRVGLPVPLVVAESVKV